MADKIVRRVSIYVDGDRVIDNLKGIKAEYKKLLNEQAKMPVNSKEYIESVQKIRKLDNILAEHRSNIKQSGSAWDKLKANVEDVTGMGIGKMALFGAAAGALWSVFRNGIQDMMKVSKALSELKALTGASAGDMKYYRQEALNMQLQMNITAEDAVKAFQYVGGAKPELLKSKEALAAVTREAVILAKASGMELPDAAKNLTGAMNQFNLPADQARRTINALAAGAKEGSAEIEDQTESMKNFGAVANMANIPLEASIGLIQTLAEKSIKGGEAGTGLRNFLLTLESGAKATKPSVVGLEQALKNLNAKHLDATQLTKMFGKENVVVAQTLIANSEKVKTYTKAVTGTNEAYTQAEERSQNLSAALSDLGNSWSAWIQGLMGSDGWLFRIVNRLSQFVRFLNEISKSKEQLEQENDAAGMAKSDTDDKKAVDKYGKNEIVNMKATLAIYQQQRDKFKKMYDEDMKRIQSNPILAAMYNDKLMAKTMPAIKGADQYNTYDKLSKQQTTRVKNAETYLEAKKNPPAADGAESKNSTVTDPPTAAEKKSASAREKEKEEADRLRQQILDQEYKLRNEIAAIREDLANKLKSEEEKEIIAANDKYAKLADEAGGNAELIAEIEELKWKEIGGIRDKYSKEAADKLADDLLKQLELEQQEFDAREAAERAISEALMGDKDREKERIKQHYQELIALALKYKLDTTDLYKAMKAELEALDSGGKKDMFGMSEKDWEGFNKRFTGVIEMAGGLTSMWQSYDQLRSAQENKSLKESERRNDKEKTSLKKKLDSGIISRKTYDKKVAQLDNQMDEKKREIAVKQAKRQKAIQSVLTIINTASAIMGFMSDKELTPWMRVAMSVMAGITGGIQLATINAAEVPGYQEGGRVKGKQLAWLSEDDKEEGVINNKTLTNSETAPIANWLLDRQEGKSAPFPTRSMPAVNSSGAVSAVNKSREVVVVVKQESTVMETNTQSLIPNAAILEEIRKMNEFLKDPENRRAYLTHEALDQRESEKAIQKQLSTLKK